MKYIFSWLLAALLLVSSITPAEAGIRRKVVQFKQGTTETLLKGRIKGRETRDYLVQARQGQTMSVIFKPDSHSAYFNLLPPNSDTALLIGSTSGNRFTGTLPDNGVYTIRVYLMRSAARRSKSARYTLRVGVTGVEKIPARTPVILPPLAPRPPFDRLLELDGIRFRVTCRTNGPTTILRITPSGLERANSPIERTIDGYVTGAEVADLDADGSPEIYVYLASAGNVSAGSLVAYSANRRRSLGEIYLPPLTQEKNASQGYRGHDEFAVLEGVLGRRFPVYRETDTDGKATGWMRQLQYKLTPGEAGWILKLDKVVEY